MSRSIAEHHWRRAREIAQRRELQSVFDMQLLWESVINHFELSNCLYQCGRYETELDDRENPPEDRKIPGDQLSRGFRRQVTCVACKDILNYIRLINNRADYINLRLPDQISVIRSFEGKISLAIDDENILVIDRFSSNLLAGLLGQEDLPIARRGFIWACHGRGLTIAEFDNATIPTPDEVSSLLNYFWNSGLMLCDIDPRRDFRRDRVGRLILDFRVPVSFVVNGKILLIAEDHLGKIFSLPYDQNFLQREISTAIKRLEDSDLNSISDG